MKKELQTDEAWLEFTGLTAQIRQKIQQTSLAALRPPHQKSKARYMNLEPLLDWGTKMLFFLDGQEKQSSNEFDPQQVKEKLGWIVKFRDHLEEWDELFEIISTTESFVRHEGLYHGCHLELKLLMTHLNHTARSQRVCGQLLAFVEEESRKATAYEQLLGSSEVVH